MGGVDRANQFVTYYKVKHKGQTKSRFFRIFIHFLELIIHNSYVLYKIVCDSQKKKSLSRLDYRKELVRLLLMPIRLKKNIPRTKNKIVEEYKEEINQINFIY